MPIMEAILESNRRQIDRAFHMVMAAGTRKVGVLGLAFKSGTDDLRESPVVTLVEMLIGKGCQVLIHDQNVARANIIGANKEFVEREIPHLWGLMRSNAEDVITASDVLIVGNASPEYSKLGALTEGRIIIDLARAIPGRASDGKYVGMCW
jgi:GDP-mannose 6-dehydrogenase